MARKSRRKPGGLDDLKRMLWDALVQVEWVLRSAGEEQDREWVLKASHALSQLGGQYVRLLEGSELEARLAALEARQSDAVWDVALQD